jgi:hypothetical protein
MKEKDFIEKVKRQGGWVDIVDVYRLIDLYTERFGILFTELSIEDELMYMWIKIQEVDNLMKRCNTCDELKPMDEFHKNVKMRDGKSYYCRVCAKKFYRKRKDLEDVIG